MAENRSTAKWPSTPALGSARNYRGTGCDKSTGRADTSVDSVAAWVSFQTIKAQEPAPQGSPAGTVEIPPPPGSSLFKQRWAELIKKVYAADPLVCARCGGAMRIIAFIDQPDVIEKILTHLGLWPHPSHARPPSASRFTIRMTFVTSPR